VRRRRRRRRNCMRRGRVGEEEKERTIRMIKYQDG
jgi:hypothetical protein